MEIEVFVEPAKAAERRATTRPREPDGAGVPKYTRCILVESQECQRPLHHLVVLDGPFGNLAYRVRVGWFIVVHLAKALRLPSTHSNSGVRAVMSLAK